MRWRRWTCWRSMRPTGPTVMAAPPMSRRVDRRDEDRRQRQPAGHSHLRSDRPEILAEAKATDGAEDEVYGEERGDELPEQRRTLRGGGFSARPSESLSERTRTAGRPSPSPRCRLSSKRRTFSGGAAGTGRVVAGGQAPARAAPLGEPRLDPARSSRPAAVGRRATASRPRHPVSFPAAYEHYRATAHDRLGQRAGGRTEPYWRPKLPGPQSEHHRSGCAADPDRFGLQVTTPRPRSTSSRSSSPLRSPISDGLLPA
jgi:hypothetical protein